jgi:hypothetical protein
LDASILWARAFDQGRPAQFDGPHDATMQGAADPSAGPTGRPGLLRLEHWRDPRGSLVAIGAAVGLLILGRARTLWVAGETP